MKRQTMKFASGIFVILALVLIGPKLWGQTGDNAASDKVRQDSFNGKVDTRPYETIYLKYATQPNDANEITVVIRNLIDPSAKVFIVPNQSAITMRGTTDELALAKKIIDDLDRPKKTYRLTYTIAEIDGGKRIGVQHYAITLAEGQRTVMKQGNRVPVATGSYKPGGGGDTQTQFTYLDVGLNFEATLDKTSNGAKLRTKVEQLSIAEGLSGVGPQDPILRQTELEGTTYLTFGKPQVLGSLDIPGSTRHLDVEVMMEPVTQ
jgi:type II secretory pathway component GspD/PulD (secretin)